MLSAYELVRRDAKIIVIYISDQELTSLTGVRLLSSMLLRNNGLSVDLSVTLTVGFVRDEIRLILMA